MSGSQRQLFGTDGIRGRANFYPLTPQALIRLAQAAAHRLVGKYSPGETRLEWPRVVIGKDTRSSGDMMEAAFTAGLNSVGIDVISAGVIPTPAIACLTREQRCAFGVVVSASHNPWHDNGIKFFGPDGYKLDDAVELQIENLFLGDEDLVGSVTGVDYAPCGRSSRLERVAEHYAHFVRETVHDNSSLLSGLKIVLDTANGAAFRTSPLVLEKLGAEVVVKYDEPNGLNINADCGCTHPETLRRLVKETGAQVGIAHDGDADRVLLCDETGSPLDGDELMAIAAVDMLERGELSHETLVATIMSNKGLDEVVAAHGGRVIRAGVGDRYVIEAMRKGGYSLGGEQSGHLIFHDFNTTGDGIIAAVQILSTLQRSGKPLSELRKILHKFPQAQRNITVSKKIPVDEMAETGKRITALEAELGSNGRVLVRYSGTEPLLRLLIEARDGELIEKRADEIAATAKAELN